MSNEWRLLRTGALTALAARSGLMFLGLIASAILARLLPQQELGTYFLILNAVHVLVLLSMFGSAAALQRFIGKFFVTENWYAVRTVVTRELKIIATVSLIVTILLILGWDRFASFLQSPATADLLWIVLVLISFGIIQELASVYFRSVRLMKIGVLVLELPMQFLFVIGLIVALVLAIPISLGVVVSWRSASLVATTTIAAGLAVWHLMQQPAKGDASCAPETVELTHIGLPLALHGLASWLLTSTDLWFLGIFRPGADVGIYGAVSRLAVLIGTLLMLVNLVLPSMLAGLYEQGRRAEIENLLRRIATITGWTGILVFSIFLFTGDWLTGLLFGPDFDRGVTPLLLLAAGKTFSVAAGSPGWLLNMTGHHKIMLWITVASVILNLLLNFIGVKLAGMNGVAGATMIALVVQNVMLMIAARRLVGVRTHMFISPLRAIA